jgi:hypothetical protein
MILKSLAEIQEYIEYNNIHFFNTYNDLFACPCCGQVMFDSELLEKLDYLRNLIGEPIKITSAYRCESHNDRVGGKSNSSHLKGLAVDVKIFDSAYRFKVLNTCLQEELFNRIGIAETFLHLDIDVDKTQNVVWTY